MYCIRTLALLTALLMMTAGCGSESTSETVVLSGGEMQQLSIDRSIGSETGDSTQVFGSITDVCHDINGNILVLDQVARGVKVFTPDGEYICQIGRGGEGPGEMQMPLYVAGLSDSRIIVHDPMNNAFLSFDSTFSYLENISLWDNGPPIETIALDSGSFAGILLEFDMEQDQPTSALHQIS